MNKTLAKLTRKYQVKAKATVSIKDAIKAGIEEYAGITLQMDEIKFHKDPKVSGTWAIRVLGKKPMDFLLVGGELENWEPKTIVENLEECDFETWPPKSGGLKFF